LADVADSHLDGSTSIDEHEGNDLADQKELILEAATINDAVNNLNRLDGFLEYDRLEVLVLVDDYRRQHF
jgi:hypothetical protein